MKNKNDKDITKELHNKLNLLALRTLEEIEQLKSKNKPIDFEQIKPILIAIKEIKDLVKVNYKIRERDLSELISVDEELESINMLEEALYEETKK